MICSRKCAPSVEYLRSSPPQGTSEVSERGGGADSEVRKACYTVDLGPNILYNNYYFIRDLGGGGYAGTFEKEK